MSSSGLDPLGGLEASAQSALERGARHLQSLRSREGAWRTQVTCSGSEWARLLLLAAAGVGDASKVRTAVLAQAVDCAEEWPADTAALIYFGLRLTGAATTESALPMLRARLESEGGLGMVSPALRILLGVLGVRPVDPMPRIPPELFLWPNSGLFGLPVWGRAIAAALVVAQDTPDAVRDVALSELPGRTKSTELAGKAKLLHTIDSTARGWAAPVLGSLHRRALQRAEAWIRENQTTLAGLPDVAHFLAPAFLRLGLPAPASWMAEDRDDTPLAAWCMKNLGGTEPVAFKIGEDTRSRALAVLTDQKEQASALAEHQSPSGGWAAYKPGPPGPGYPMLAAESRPADEPCPDCTGLAMEALAHADQPRWKPALQRGVRFLTTAQNADGSWGSRWGVYCLHGTCFALRGLRAAGFDDREAVVLRAGEWLRCSQNADGGWGEDAVSFRQGAFVAGSSTPTQTAWAVLGLLAGGDTTSESLRHGVAYLLREQTAEGGWRDIRPTSVSLPGALFAMRSLDSEVYPLLALAEFVRSRK